MTEAVKTPKFTACFPHVFEPNSFGGGEPKYELTMLFEEGASLAELEKLVLEAAIDKWGKVPAGLQGPFRNGTDKAAVDEKYASWDKRMVATAKSQFKPVVVDENVNAFENEGDFYGGCDAVAYVSAYAWEYLKKKGVSLNLSDVQKVGAGKKFGGRKPANQLFQAVAKEEVNLNDL